MQIENILLTDISLNTMIKFKSITSFLKTTQPHQISQSRSSEIHDKMASWILEKKIQTNH